MKNILNKIIVLLTISLISVSCFKDLDQSPIDPDSFTENDVFSTVEGAKSALAKLYASYSLTGQEGPAGEPDISPDDIDEGFSQYTRTLFNLNELTTDHAVVAWGDAGLQDLHGMYWTAENPFSAGMYYRLGQEVAFCNSFIQNAAQLDDPEVQYFIAEARFLRAFAYYNFLDLFGNVPLVTEPTTELPQQASKEEIFNFIEMELLEIKDLLMSDHANEFGRVDQVAAWALLSKLYLNAESWVNSDRYTDCVTYSDMVINSSYTIFNDDINGNGSAYDELFLADNGSNGAYNEFIFALNFDGIYSKTYGGSTFLIHAAVGGTMEPTDYGIDGGWVGLRTTSSLVNKFTFDVGDLNSALGGTLSDWGLVGDATENGWDGPDMEMYEVATNEYALYAELSSGEMKFRFNEDWGNNYGDDGADGTLDAFGANISVPGAGVYFVEMNLNDNTYSLTPYSSDKRGIFHTDGQTLEIEDLAQFSNGYAVGKFKNITSQGVSGSDPTFTDTDIPLIRLAEIYLNYAEAVVRGGGGDMGNAVNRINELRQRAYGSNSGNISSVDLDLDFLLDERSKELYWEGQRRTDLIRFNRFTASSYLWPWKGNVSGGIGVEEYRNLFPIPSNIMNINPNLSQNEGY